MKEKLWFGMKKIRRRKPNNRANNNHSSAKNRNSTRSSQIVAKDFEIFVTDFLTDPDGLPTDLKHAILVDTTTNNNSTSETNKSKDDQILKKIFENNDNIEQLIKTSTPNFLQAPITIDR